MVYRSYSHWEGSFLFSPLTQIELVGAWGETGAIKERVAVPMEAKDGHLAVLPWESAVKPHELLDTCPV